MQLGYHGGQCCGIKHIWGLEEGPQYGVGKQRDSDFSNFGGNNASYYAYQYREEAPTERAEDRFYRILDYCVEKWPSHLVEVAIILEAPDEEYDEYGDLVVGGDDDQSSWIPVLEKCGFKPVTTHVNCNTQNTLQTWHLTYDYETKPDFLERFGTKKEDKETKTGKAVFR